jgi:putative oxidoreductase
MTSMTQSSLIAARTPQQGAALDGAALVGRLLIAAIFLISGVGKITAPAGTIAYIASAGLPFPPLAYSVAVAVEVLGSLALIAGWHTRKAAAVMALFTLAAAFGFHAHFGDQNQFIHFFKNVAMTGGLLQVVAFGAGRFSLDGWRG